MLEMRQARLERGGDFGEMRIDQQRRAFGIGEPERDLRRREPGVDRHRDETGPRQREQAFEVEIAVEREHADPVAAPDPQSRQRAGEPRHPVAELEPRARPALKFGGGAARRGLNRAAQ